MKRQNPIFVLRDWVELYIPIASFLIMFVVFILQIFCRYVLRAPLQWAYEVTVSCYLWLVVLGACYAQREHAHVMFTLIYDKLPVRLKAFSTFLGNGIIAFAFVWSYGTSIRFVDFMKMQKTSVLKIGLNIVYAPYIIFMTMMILYMVLEMVKDFRVFTGLAKPEEIDEMLRDSMTEAQEAIAEARADAQDEGGTQA